MDIMAARIYVKRSRIMARGREEGEYHLEEERRRRGRRGAGVVSMARWGANDNKLRGIMAKDIDQ